MKMNKITGGKTVNININFEKISKKLNIKMILLIISIILITGTPIVIIMVNKNKVEQTLSKPESVDIASNQDVNDVWKVDEKEEKE